MTFLGNVIRSIASEFDGLDGHFPPSGELEAQQETAAGVVPLTEPDDPVASTVDAMSMIEGAAAVFDGDEIAQRLFEGRIETRSKVRNSVIYWSLVKKSSIPNEGL